MKFVAVKLVSLLFASTFLPAVAIAANQTERNMESPRALGRGGVFAGAYDSDDAIRLNPATLADPHGMDVQFRWFELDAFIGENTVSTIGDLISSDFSNTSPINLLTKFTEKFGQQQYGRLQLGAALRIFSFEVSPYFRSTNWLDARVPTLPEAELYSSTVFGLNIAYAFMLGKTFQVGINLRPFSLTDFVQELAFADIIGSLGDSSFTDQFKTKTGSGLATDVGMIWEFAKSHRFGLQIDDVGYTSYTFGSKEDPDLIRQRVSVGYFTRGDMKQWHIDWGVDFQDITNPDGLNLLRLLKVGGEFGYSFLSRDNDIGVSAGINEGYISLGTYLNVYFARLDIVNYGVELGEQVGQRQDRRWAISAKTTLDL